MNTNYLIVNFRFLVFLAFASSFALRGDAQLRVEPNSESSSAIRSDFAKLLISQEKAGGIVIIEQSCGSKKLDEPPQSQPKLLTGDPFEVFSKTYPAYKLIRGKETVNLLPEGYEPDFLKVKLNYLLIGIEHSAQYTLYDLLSKEDIQKDVEASLVNRGTMLSVDIGPVSPPMVPSQKVKPVYNITIREALNEIAVFYGKKIWSYTEYRCEGRSRSRLVFTSG